MKIIISGLTASGKTFVGKSLAKSLKIEFLNASTILKEIAKEYNFKTAGENWYDSAEGMKFAKYRLENPEIDLELDKRLLYILNSKQNFVVSSWVLPWLFKNKCIKIWLEAKKRVRAKRLADRDKISFERAMEIIEFRDSLNEKLYKKIYGVEIGPDKKLFDFIYENSGKKGREIAEEILKLILTL